jgi:toxin ParE1/3/4
MEIKIFPAARLRVIEIWNYTETQWGEEQADQYVGDLVGAIERHAFNPKSWKPVPGEDLNGVFVVRHARHFIFFRDLGSSSIGVISILHESMDIPNRLREDVG